MKAHYTLGLFPLTGICYRRFSWPWWKDYLSPSTYWRTLKYFCQRGYRGYADCDSWDANSYMESVVLGVVISLKKSKRGCPASLVLSENEPFEVSFARWQSILQEIIDGLEASYELQAEETILPGTYSEEPLEFEELPGQPQYLRIKPSDTPRFNSDLYEQWQAPLKKKKKRAIYLLHKYWENLWD